MLRPQTLLLTFFLLLSFTWLSSYGLWEKTQTGWAAGEPGHHKQADHSLEKLRLKAEDAKLFVQQKEYNDAICFLADMSMPSGQNRFFVYDLKKDTIRNSGLVTHGRCNQSWLEGRQYGNTVDCGCTSLGKYKVGYSYNGRFGLAYKLYGLDKTNDKAFQRFVVLHSRDCVPETESEDEICQSDGCPSVSPGFLQWLKPIINESKKPVLLWVYE